MVGNMTPSDRERARMEKLEALKAENHIGPEFARLEELARRPAFRIEWTQKRGGYTWRKQLQS